MKKIMLSICVCLFMTGLLRSQVTKADFEKALVEVGSSMEAIKTLDMNNVKIFYNDGSSATNYYRYQSENAKGTNSFYLTENGVKIMFFNNEKEHITNVQFYPYNNIARFSVSPESIDITLKQ